MKNYLLSLIKHPNGHLALTNSSAHHDIESAFFEFRKMKAFLEIGVTVRVPHVSDTPIKAAQEYVDSLLMIDLISVWDMSVIHFFKFFKLKQQKGKSEFQILEENGHLINPRYLAWYKSWRNETAHHLKRRQWHELQQATSDVARQFTHWNLKTGTYDFLHYCNDPVNGIVRIGSAIGNISVLEYETWSEQTASGTSSSSRKTIDLSFDDFIQTK